MQTVCAHCLSPLKPKERGQGLILCAKCEHNWEAGVANLPVKHLEKWQTDPAWLPAEGKQEST